MEIAKISTLKISAEVCGLIFLLWEITCKKNASLSSTKQAARTARHARFVTLWEIGLLLPMPTYLYPIFATISTGPSIYFYKISTILPRFKIS